VDVKSLEQARRLAMIIHHRSAPPCCQECRERMKADLDLGMQENDRVARLEHGVVEAGDDSHAATPELGLGEIRERAAALPTLV
jgi:hypothetical protein